MQSTSTKKCSTVLCFTSFVVV